MILSNQLLLVLAAFWVGAVLSCRDQEAGGEASPEKAEPPPVIEAEPEPSPKIEIVFTGHLGVIEKFMDLKKDFMSGLTSVTDVESAREFEEGLEGRRAQLRELLEEAKGLPAPDDGAKRHFQTLQESFSDQGTALMDQFLARVRSSPEREGLEEILGKLSADAEAEELNRKLTEIYH